MAGSYIADRPEKPALVEGDAILIGDSTVTGAGSGKKHLPKQSAKASSVALRTAGGQLKAADGVDNDDVVTMQQKAAESSKVVRLSRALAKDPDAGGTASIFADFKSQGFGLGNSDGIDEVKTDLELFNNFSRTSSGWRFNSRGQLEEVVAGMPRYNYNPATGEAEGILIEGQRTNLLTYSEQFDDASWSKLNSIISPNSEQSPDGSLTADKLIANTNNTNHRVSKFTGTAGALVTFSVYAKAGEYSSIRINNSTSGRAYVSVDLLTGQTSGSGDFYVSSGREEVGNGWYRCWLTVNNSDSSTFQIIIEESFEKINFAGDGTSGIYIWGAQYEEGEFPTSYIQTSGSQVTRTADIVARTLGAEFNPNEGTFVVEWKVGGLLSSGGAIFSVGSDTKDRLMLQVTGSGVFAFIQDSATSSTVASGLPGDIMRVAISYSIGNPSKWSYNGLPTRTPGGAKLPFLNNPSVAVGDRAWALGSDTYTGKFKLVKYEPHAVSDTRLQELSKL